MITLLLALFLVFSSTAFAGETASFELHLTKGILAFDQKDYTKAIDDLKAALKEKPEDPSATLYLGISLYRSGNELEGERILKKALTLDPLSPRTNFELGVLYYKRGIYDEARDFFETARSHSKEKGLTELAAYYLGEIEKQKTTAKSWAVSISAGIQYDSNVILEPDDGAVPEGISRDDDWRGFLYLDGKFTPALTDNLNLGLTYSFYQSIQRELYDFNVQQHLPGFVVNYAPSRYLFLKVHYTFEYTNVGKEDYLFSHSISPAITVAEGKGFFTALRYRYQTKDFKNTPLFVTNTERDGENNLAGITQYIPIGRVATISFGYTYDHDHTDKKYWTYNGHSGEIGVKLDFGKGWGTDLTGVYYRKVYYKEDYPGEDKKRKDTTWTYAMNLAKNINSKLDIIVGWMNERNSSTIDVYDYRRNITTLMLRVNL